MAGEARHKVVVAAVIERDGEFLLHQRPPHGWGAGLWEFPGGKLEVGEDPRAALVRECREELGVEVTVHEVIDLMSWHYQDIGHVLLLFLHATIDSGEPQPLEGGAIAWAKREQLMDYEWLEADYPFVEKLIRNKRFIEER